MTLPWEHRPSRCEVPVTLQGAMESPSPMHLLVPHAVDLCPPSRLTQSPRLSTTGARAPPTVGPRAATVTLLRGLSAASRGAPSKDLISQPHKWFEIADSEPRPCKLSHFQTCPAAQAHICTFQSPLSICSKDKRG